jgi:hypothetical protein
MCNFVGRMSFQAYGGTALCGAMMIWYRCVGVVCLIPILLLLIRSVPAVVFWQWANQSFNAFVNYTNRNAKSSLTKEQIGIAYVSATSSALITALGLKAIVTKVCFSLLH